MILPLIQQFPDLNLIRVEQAGNPITIIVNIVWTEDCIPTFNGVISTSVRIYRLTSVRRSISYFFAWHSCYISIDDSISRPSTSLLGKSNVDL